MRREKGFKETLKLESMEETRFRKILSNEFYLQKEQNVVKKTKLELYGEIFQTILSLEPYKARILKHFES